MEKTLAAMTRRGFLAVGSAGLGGAALAACTSSSETPEFAADTDALESPMLAELVAAGSLPELAERLPATPMVVEPIEGTGAFGGTLQRAQTDATATGVMQSFAPTGLLEWNVASDASQESLAESYEISDDNRVYTFTLREGLKWSDGEPFTSADLAFAIENWLGNATLVPVPPFWYSDVDQQLPMFDAPDERTVVIEFREPFSLFEKYMCHPGVSTQFIKPKHYLEQFHPDFADQADVDAASAAAGFDSWDQYFADRDNTWTNPDRPTMGAFKVTAPASAQSGTATLERNAYFWKTDPDGRQLPYVDKIQVQVLDQSALDLRAANGDLDFQGYYLGYSTTETYLANAESRGFEVLRWTDTWSLLSLCFNLSHQNEALREVFLLRDFRFAMSHAINRDEINSTLLGGLGIIRNPVAPEGTEYGVDGSGQTAIEYDVDRANELLDGLGLALAGDVRALPDGTPLELTLLYMDDNQGMSRADAFGMVQEMWAAVGVRLNLRPVDSTLYAQLRLANDFDVDGTSMIEEDFDLEPVWFVPTGGNSHTAPGFGLWYSTSGADGIEPPDEFKQLLANWDALRSAPTADDRVASGQEIMQAHNDNVYVIGLMKLPFQPVVVNSSLKNVRDDAPKMSFYYGREGITKTEQIFFE
ncbi:extracellular solute-binding protein family 5 [Beutenbergia cavernae DSM 12333]|uniref:Extracellular solute-binding protein family 5 n=1 Tax=Beutenbergia cavernae (strain ATCC BAA-8 / DSM 12333 / CCUG 43141 / JCM 11478 / NBRC 16432 / NCIMB 13614 / HKI 0122) TaxID=471853 RepID=C5BXW4_BEUC1|nr:ABC transporter substrate-binding protein [Beutenbergia cavernae]ACQ78858.1 extracellular solute-binding protein family 5 [Beutenbergia cavernae DSM 12333]